MREKTMRVLTRRHTPRASEVTVDMLPRTNASYEGQQPGYLAALGVKTAKAPPILFFSSGLKRSQRAYAREYLLASLRVKVMEPLFRRDLPRSRTA
jgi:hypothetical protein